MIWGFNMSYYEMMAKVANRYGLESEQTIKFCSMVERGADPFTIGAVYADLMNI